MHGAALLLLLVYGSARAMRDRMGWHVLTAVRGLIMNAAARRWRTPYLSWSPAPRA